MRPIVSALVLLAVIGGGTSTWAADTDFTVLAYHDVVDSSSALTYDGITLRNLAVQLDWLRQNGYRVVSVDDVVAAQQGQRPLPPKAVLLTFDDGYRSFYTHVYPLLRAFDYPAVLSVVGSFLDVPPRAQVRYGAGLVAREDFVSWGQLREMQRSGLVEIGSHTYGLHTTVFTNPQGGEVPAAIGHGFIRRRPGLRISERIPLEMPQPRFGDIRSLLTLPFRPYLSLAIELAQAAIDYAYDPRTGRYETDDGVPAAGARRPRPELRPPRRPARRAAARDHLAVRALERGDRGGRPGGGHAHQPDARSRACEHPRAGTHRAVLRRGEPEVSDSCPTPSRIRPSPPCCGASASTWTRCLRRRRRSRTSGSARSSTGSSRSGRTWSSWPRRRPLPAAGCTSRPTGCRSGRISSAERRGRSSTRTGTEVYAWLPAEQAGRDADTILAVHTALSRTVPFHGVGLGPISLATELPPGGLPPGVSRWDPRAPRWVREGQDRARLSAEGRFALRVVESVTRYQPAAKVLDVVDLARLRRPTDMATDAVDYLALRWDGRPEEALRKLREPRLARGGPLGPAGVLQHAGRAGGVAARPARRCS